MEIKASEFLWFITQELILELELFYFEILFFKTKLFSELNDIREVDQIARNS